MTRRLRWLIWSAGSVLVLAWLLFVWRLSNQGDDRWITVLVGGPTTLFVALVGVAIVAEGSSWRDRWVGLVVCLAILASVLL